MENVGDLLFFWAVVALRVLVPLTIPAFPLPGILASLILDGIDQSLFQSFTSMPLDGYQGYDKALDIYYLSIAYIATMRNWTNRLAFRLSRFLFYYRLVGVVLFEILQFRWLLLLFPNVFEYFFIFYEVVRLRWDPRRLTRALLLGAVGAIWLLIKLPQEYWLHVAQLDATDAIKVQVLGYPPTADWGVILASRPLLFAGLFITAGLLLYALRRLLRPRLPGADWSPSLLPNANLPAVEEDQYAQTINSMVSRLVDYELFEKTALITLLVIIFAQILPGTRATNIELALYMVAVILINTIVSEGLVRRGIRWRSGLSQSLVMVAVNLPVMLLISLLRYGTIPLLAFDNIIVFVALLSVIITLYDRCWPVCCVRFRV